MPDIIGQAVILTVSDANRSAALYCDLLGTQETSRYVQPDGHVGLVHLAELRSGVELCLVDHGADPGSFSEFRVGLDHLEFVVARRSDLDAWAFRLDELDLGHSSVKEPPYTVNSILTFRDPTTSSRSSSVVRPPPDRRYGGWLVYRVAVWVAVHRRAVPSEADRLGELIQLETNPDGYHPSC